MLGGNFDVLSTEIFFAIVGAQNDPALAAILAVVLLFFTLAAFYAQRFWLGRRSYTTVSGKGDAGMHPLLPRPLRLALYAVVGLWVALTLVVYGTIIYASFVKLWGVDPTLTLAHYRQGLRRRLDRVRPALARLGLVLLLDDDLDRARLRAADRRRSAS